MSYNGTVRCSYCYTKGHNRRSCPQLKAYIAANPDSYTAQTFKQRAKYASIRKCRYCQTEGHNRRTCLDLKKDMEYYRVLCKEMRAEALAWLKDNDVGVGALVAYARYGSIPEHIGIVRGAELAWITPERVDHRSGYDWAKDTPDAFHPFLSKCGVVVVASAKHPTEKRHATALQVLNPVKVKHATWNLPQGWDEGTDAHTVEARHQHFKDYDRYSVRRYTLKMPVEDYQKN